MDGRERAVRADGMAMGERADCTESAEIAERVEGPESIGKLERAGCSEGIVTKERAERGYRLKRASRVYRW
jgi:hypothetical protein